MKIKQGDAIDVPVAVTANGSPVDPTEISSVEFYIGGIRKLYPDEVSYDSSGYFLVPLTQEETFGFEADSTIQLDVRVLFDGGQVIGSRRIANISIVDAISEEVL